MKKRNIKNILKVAPVAFALSISFLAIPTQSFAENSPISQVEENSSLQEGLSGHYYQDGYIEGFGYFMGWMQIQKKYLTGDFSSLPTEAKQQKETSIYWTGKIQVDETGEYSFEASANGISKLLIDGQTISTDSVNKTKIYLEKNKLYDIRINANYGFSEDLKLYWITPKNQKEIIPAKHFFSPVDKPMPSGGPSIRSEGCGAS
ncbi:PA14 domain-containing protein [Bacillus cereus]|uniref:PA14 domain-containing protein n=1 Tax=Bacillus cereus TaxID=1396 RepID=UPI002ABF49D2|nr:PA14 domain-containing protein [Bacillus cereus]MDZ4411731.1 PA14 domain-containing protein [Bacillus cereus]MDZ4534314.1 PA14 domain-containing protein [Bacillus cereus]